MAAALHISAAPGKTTARGNGSFVYDQTNRLTTATVSGTTTTYAYDGDGKRASATTGSTTSYAYDANRGLPVVLSDGSRKYVWGNGLAYSVDSGGNISVAHADGLGSVRALTDTSGTLVQTYLTDPFGNPLSSAGPSTQPFQFTGEQKDGTGLYYLRARMYDPLTGRFLSRDPILGDTADPSSLHRYAYVNNNPTNLTDPTGHAWWDVAKNLIELGSRAFQRAGPWLNRVGERVSRILRGSYRGGPGCWVTEAETMSERAAAYQSQITGRMAGQVYRLNGVNFDGFKDGVLLEAKGPGYAQFIRNGRLNSGSTVRRLSWSRLTVSFGRPVALRSTGMSRRRKPRPPSAACWSTGAMGRSR